MASVAPQQCHALQILHHLYGVHISQWMHAKHRVAHQIDEYSAAAAGEERTKRGIHQGAEQQFYSTRNHLLHDSGGHGTAHT